MTTRLLLHFDEPTENGVGVPPSDESGNLEDMSVSSTPERITSLCGLGHWIEATPYYYANDKADGSTLLTRTMSIQFIGTLSAGALASGGPNPIICRGDASGGAANYTCYELLVECLDGGTGLCYMNLAWQTSAGVREDADGVYFTLNPALYEFYMITVTRRWVTSTDVVLNYYLNDQLIGETRSLVGDIGGATTGVLYVGTGTTGMFWNGVLDELKVTDYEMCLEEIEATWLRITKYQPEGYTMIKGLLPPGFPISFHPNSRVQGDYKIMGHGLGFAVAQARNAQMNTPPDRAYGPALESWESIIGSPARPLDDIQRRRSRVLSHLRQRQGVSIPGVTESLHEVLGLNPDQLEVLAFSNRQTDDFSLGLRTERWWAEPSAAWTISGGALRGQSAGGTDVREGIISGATYRNAKYTRISFEVGDPAREVVTPGGVAFKVTPTAIPVGGFAGIRLFNWVKQHWFFLGMAYDGVNHYIVYRTHRNGTDSGAVVLDTVGATAFNLMLKVMDGAFLGVGGTAEYELSWAGASNGTDDSLVFDQQWDWVDFVIMSDVASLGTAFDVTFDDFQMIAPKGKRPFYHYVFRDPTLPGSYDVAAGHAVMQRTKHGHTEGTVITSRSLLCDDNASLCDRGPMGAI